MTFTVGQRVRVLAQPLDDDDPLTGTVAVVTDPDNPYGVEVQLPRGTAVYYRTKRRRDRGTS